MKKNDFSLVVKFIIIVMAFTYLVQSLDSNNEFDFSAILQRQQQ